MNKEYLKTTSGTLKCITIVLIAVVFGVGAAGYFTSDYNMFRDKVRPLITDEISLWREMYFISAIAVTFCCSLINLLIHLISRKIYYNRITAFIDSAYHMLLFAILFTSGGLNAISAVRIFGVDCTSENKCQAFELKLAASGIAVLTSLLCGVVGAVVLTNRREVERDGIIFDEK